MMLTVLLRALQLVSLLVIGFGLQQVPPLAAAIQEIAKEAIWSWPVLCRRIVAVTGPTVLGGILLVGLQWAVSQHKLARKRRAITEKSDQPWLADPMWARQHIRHDSRGIVWALVMFSSAHLSVFLPLAIASEKRPLLIIWGVFGLVLLVFVRLLWLGRKWSNAELKIATLPGVIGGPFSGAAIIHHVFDKTTIFDVNLRCAQTVVRGTRKERRSELVDRWTSTQYVQKTIDSGQANTTTIPFSFAIPFDALPTDMSGSSPVRWLLTVSEKAEVNQGGATFEVPVFKTSQSDPNYQPDAEFIGQYLQKMDPLVILQRYNMQRSNQANQKSWTFHEFNTSIFVTLIVMSAMIVGLEVGLWSWIKDSNTFFFASMFPVVFLLMFCYGILYMLFWRCQILLTENAPVATDFVSELRSQPVESMAVIEAKSGLLGFRKTLTVPATRDVKLVCKLDHRVNNKEQWSIHLAGEADAKLKLLSTLEGAHEAEVVAAWLAEQLKISHRRVRPGDSFL